MLLSLLLGGYYSLYVVLLRVAITVAVFFSLLVSADRVINVTKYLFIRAKARLTGRQPQHAWNFKPLPQDADAYPKVAIQLPMFNERAVCQAIIDCCCEMEWPATRLYIQVLDDSTDKTTRELVDEKVLEWRERGVAVDCLRRTNRQGYKAGAMKEGMELLAAGGYEYVAVFDADFKPEPDFLLRTVPYLEGNPTVGYVQTRWVFTNTEESYLTKAQEVSLNYHMRCEQYVHSATGSFFNFNGTAGVWRLACIESAGGWLSRTTVEDMDLSLRAYVKGWRAIFLEDVTCLNELPASFFAFRKQQHRWTCGPVQLWSHATADIWRSSMPLPRKLELSLLYFGVRKAATHFVALGFFCTLVPLAAFTPEVRIPAWVLVHLPVVVTVTTSYFTPRGWVYSILYVLFENAMGMVKLWAVVTGLLDLQRAQEWVVTTKLGSSDKRPGTATALMTSCKIYAGELLMGMFLLGVGMASMLSGHHWGLATYMVLQGCVFLSFGFNLVDRGGLLGGRLDVGLLPPLAVGAQRAKRAAVVKRTSTIPLIQLSSHEHLPLTHATLSAKSSPALLGRIHSGDAAVIMEEGAGAVDSPSHSAGSGSTPDSLHDSESTIGSASSVGSAVLPSMLAGKPLGDGRFVSPTSSLVNIYAPPGPAVSAGSRSKGFRFSAFMGNGYQSDHSD